MIKTCVLIILTCADVSAVAFSHLHNYPHHQVIMELVCMCLTPPKRTWSCSCVICHLSCFLPLHYPLMSLTVSRALLRVEQFKAEVSQTPVSGMTSAVKHPSFQVRSLTNTHTHIYSHPRQHMQVSTNCDFVWHGLFWCCAWYFCLQLL